MKRLVAVLLCLVLAVSCLTACGGDDNGGSTSGNGDTPATSGKKVTINLYSFTDEIPNMVKRYITLNPDCGFEVKDTIIPTTNGEYQPALDAALQAGGSEAPDLYAAEAAFVLKYTQGEASSMAATYKDLGIDIDNRISSSQIAKYAYEIGTRPSDGAVVALPYQATGGCYIYRRSIAKAVWGTDEPATIQEKIGGATGTWDKFWTAAEELKAKGYVIMSGDGDIWHAIENSSDKGWIVDGKLYIDPKREEFLDISKMLTDKGYSNITTDWSTEWQNDMKGDSKVFGFFGPAWLINYTLAPNSGSYEQQEDGSQKFLGYFKDGIGSAGDWAVCNSPVGFSWGGTYLLANKNIPEEKKAAAKKIIEWITLDTDENSLQYKWANGTLYDEEGTKDTVSSGVVMSNSNGALDFLGGQNMFDYFVPANQKATGKNLTPYDEKINSFYRDQVRAYAAGTITRDEALANFKANVKNELEITE